MILGKCFAYCQYLVPQHLLTRLMGKLANSRISWLKNSFIRIFVKLYAVDMSEAAITEPTQYPTFNDFFTRKLTSTARKIATGSHEIASPCDGTLMQVGFARQNQLIQAKNFHFDLESLLGGDKELANRFYDGAYATIYLAPHDYHRVHMPLSGTLEKTIFVPGKLFSVNKTTSAVIPQLFSQNERLIAVFNTDAGKMVVILVGAMIVGSIQMAWMGEPVRTESVDTTQYRDEISLTTGQELGLFKLGSTVIVLFERQKMQWQPALLPDQIVRMGQVIGNRFST